MALDLLPSAVRARAMSKGMIWPDCPKHWAKSVSRPQAIFIMRPVAGSKQRDT